MTAAWWIHLVKASSILRLLHVVDGPRMKRTEESILPRMRHSPHKRAKLCIITGNLCQQEQEQEKNKRTGKHEGFFCVWWSSFSVCASCCDTSHKCSFCLFVWKRQRQRFSFVALHCCCIRVIHVTAVHTHADEWMETTACSMMHSHLAQIRNGGRKRSAGSDLGGFRRRWSLDSFLFPWHLTDLCTDGNREGTGGGLGGRGDRYRARTACSVVVSNTETYPYWPCTGAAVRALGTPCCDCITAASKRTPPTLCKSTHRSQFIA